MNNEVPRPRFSRRELVWLTILFSATFVVATGIQMGNALFPALSRLLGVPVGTVTLLVSVWAFTELLAPLFGPPSDRYGHGMFVLIGMGSFTISNLLCAFAPGFTPLLVSQVFVGLGYAIFNFSASAVVGDLLAHVVRARAMSLVMVISIRPANDRDIEALVRSAMISTSSTSVRCLPICAAWVMASGGS